MGRKCHIAIIGAGAAGLAATYAAVQRGAEVTLLDPSFGASGLTSGAVDEQRWELVARAGETLGQAPAARPLPQGARAFIDEVGLWSVPAAAAPLVRLATSAGRIRIARGRDRALLDLAPLPSGARVLLPRVTRNEWDADGIARCLNADPYAQAHRLHFAPVASRLVRDEAERLMAPGELAACHDDPQLRAKLTERLTAIVGAEREADRQVDAVLVGPWLGAKEPQSQPLSSDVGVPVGEILSGLTGAAGLRFEAARDRLLSTLGVEREPRRVTTISLEGEQLRLTTVAEGSEATEVGADAAVLAVGGLGSGGLRYTPPECPPDGADEPTARVPFALSIAIAVPGLRLHAHGRRLDVVSSLQGPTLDEVAWPDDADPGLLEAVGIHCDGAQAAPLIYAAGDVVADRPRTMLQAIRSGLQAGSAAVLGRA